MVIFNHYLSNKNEWELGNAGSTSAKKHDMTFGIFETKKPRNEETEKLRNQDTSLFSIEGRPLPLNIPTHTAAPAPLLGGTREQ